MPVSPHSRDGLLARFHTVTAEVAALAAQRNAFEAKLVTREAEARRILLLLARMPGFQAPLPPSLSAPSWIPLKAAAREFGRATDTLLRHGKPAGWCWKQGGRWVCDPAGVAEFMKGASRERA